MEVVGRIPRPDNGIPNDDGFVLDVAVGVVSRAHWETWQLTECRRFRRENRV